MTFTKEGIEAIAFQSNSQLAKDLVSMFDQMFMNIFAYDKKHPDAKPNDRFSDLHKHFKNNYAQQFMDIIKKHTNIHVNRIYIFEPKSACGLFAIDLSLGDIGSVGKVIDTMSGQTAFDRLSPEAKQSAYFEMSKSLDIKTGAIDVGKLSDKVKLSVDIYFDFGFAFFVNELSPNVPALVSEEIAAIILHEIGHITSLIEHSSNLGYIGKSMKETALNLSKNKDRKETIDRVLKQVKDAIPEKAISSNEKSKNIASGLQKVLINLAESHSKTKTTGLFFNMFTMVFGTLLYLTMTIYFSLIFVLVSSTLFAVNLLQVEVNRQKVTDSNDIFTSRNLSYFERIADEFVVRHGLGSYLASALQKVAKFSATQNGMFGMLTTNKTIHNSTLIVIYLDVVSFIGRIFDFNMTKSSLIYEDDLTRIEQVLQANMAIFKIPNLPIEVRDRYLSETKRLMNIVAKEKRNYSSIISDILWTYLIPLSLPSVMLEIISSGRLSSQMKQLLDNLDKLMDNKLYYYSALFKSLIK